MCAFYKWHTNQTNTMNWDNGDTIDKTNFNGNWQSVAPIGGVIAWDKTLTGVPQTLPESWIECNGQTISDPDSPMDGQTVRDLNGNNSFLRGNSTSGGTGGSETHTHTGTTGDNSASEANSTNSGGNSKAANPHTHDFTSATSSTLPTYCEMVWIMRIK